MTHILITGASSEIAKDFIRSLNNCKGNLKLAFHCNKNTQFFKKDKYKSNNFKILKYDLSNINQCEKMLNEYFVWSKNSIDIFIQFHGSICSKKYWTEVKEKDLLKDVKLNFISSFYLLQKVYKKMKKKGGKIILTSTSSASHGGGPKSFGYGLSKYFLEYLTKLIAREGGRYDIKCNSIAPGFINTKLHKNMKTKKELSIRSKFNILKKAGKTKDILPILEMLISNDNSFMTGQVINIDGGDWL